MTHNISNEILSIRVKNGGERRGRTQPGVVICTGTSSVSRGYLPGGNDGQDIQYKPGGGGATPYCKMRFLQWRYGSKFANLLRKFSFSLVSLTAVVFITSRSHQRRYSTTDCTQDVPYSLPRVTGTSETMRYKKGLIRDLIYFCVSNTKPPAAILQYYPQWEPGWFRPAQVTKAQ